mmetsp:Transcript_39069/g.34751  ORF Transcript_39069/g.34751 Transcript_39069/m.34751 type:complete len:248 (+) Transcript_39069:2266-3009(+)
MEQPSVFRELAGYLSCVKMDPNVDTWYIDTDLSNQCYTPEYETFKHYMVLPSLLVYALLIPVGLFVNLYRKRTTLNNPSLRMNYGALYNEYRGQVWYWGMVVMLLKLILMFVGSTLFDDLKTKALTIFIIIYIYYLLYSKFQPYERNSLFSTERIALQAYLITIFAALYVEDNILSYITWIVLALVVLLNIVVLALMIWGIFGISFMRKNDYMKRVFKNLKKGPQLDVDFGEDDVKYDANVTVNDDE